MLVETIYCANLVLVALLPSIPEAFTPTRVSSHTGLSHFPIVVPLCIRQPDINSVQFLVVEPGLARNVSVNRNGGIVVNVATGCEKGRGKKVNHSSNKRLKSVDVLQKRTFTVKKVKEKAQCIIGIIIRSVGLSFELNPIGIHRLLESPRRCLALSNLLKDVHCFDVKDASAEVREINPSISKLVFKFLGIPLPPRYRVDETLVGVNENSEFLCDLAVGYGLFLNHFVCNTCKGCDFRADCLLRVQVPANALDVFRVENIANSYTNLNNFRSLTILKIVKLKV